MSTEEERERAELLPGALDLLILRALLLGAGHAVGKAIKFNSEDVLRVEVIALHRDQSVFNS
jgi:hypothetical protein